MENSPRPSRLIAFLLALLPLAIFAIVLILNASGSLKTSFFEALRGLDARREIPSEIVTPPEDRPATSTSPVPKQKVTANATVVRVVDGDTFIALLDGDGEWKIRMLGINTPETVDPRRSVQCFGKQASQKAKELLEGKRVRLDADPQADERDKYGRLLRNVILPDGMDVNALMVREGYAYAYLSFPLNRERKAQLKQLENQAHASSTGLWSKDACPVHS